MATTAAIAQVRIHIPKQLNCVYRFCLEILGRIIFKHFSFCIRSRTKPALNKKWQTISKNLIQPYLLTKQVVEKLTLFQIEKEYKKHFDYIVVICPTLRINKTCHVRDWIKNEDRVWLIEPKDNLYQWIGKLSQLLSRFETLFIIDDIIANKNVDKRRQLLLELSISGRHRSHYLWLLTQSYLAIPKNFRRQAKAISVWYPKERVDLRTIHDKNDVLIDDELVVARDFFKKVKICMPIPTK